MQNTMEKQPSLDWIIGIATRAGKLLKDGYGKVHQIDYKGVIDLVTETDRKSEEFILNEIRTSFPDDAIIAEENGEFSGSSQRIWYIDPLDGTVNYAHGIPIFSVSIAYSCNGVLQKGVVYDPMRDECFSAVHGGSAKLNDRTLHVSKAMSLEESLLVTGFPYDIWKGVETNLENFAMFAVRTQGVRRLGSAALDLCYVAAGRFDGYWEIKLKPWDLAAGALIVEEAGGLITDIRGGDAYLQPPNSLIAANPVIHAEMLRLLEEQQVR